VSDLKNQITLLQEQSARKDRQLAITKGRELIRNTLSIPNSPVILNIPIEYVQDCTYSMFAKPLGEGGSGKVYLAVDTKYPETKFVVKKVDPNGIPSSFRRELEVYRLTTHTFYYFFTRCNGISHCFSLLLLTGLTTSSSSKYYSFICNN